MKTSQKQISLFTEEISTSSPGDSPVSPIASPGYEKEKKMTATSGRKCLEQYERFNRGGLLGKMFPALLIGMPVWYSKRCRLIWKLKGTKYNRLYFQLQALTPRTKGIESGLLPTPVTMDFMDPKTDKAIQREMEIIRPGRTQLANLRDVVVRQPERLYPTPVATEVTGGPRKVTGRYKTNKNGTKWTVKLQDMAHSGMLPTPTASEDAAGTIDGNMQFMLTHAAKMMDLEGTSKGGQLNPRFVLEMMGFPPTHTLEPFETKMQWIEI